MGGYIGAKTGTLVASASDIRGDISATDTTPEITLKNTTETDADGSRSGKITFKGEQSGGEESTLAQIQASHDAAADDEKGDLIFKTNDGSDGASPTEAMRIDSEQNLGLGTNAPAHRLDIVESADAFGARITNNSDGSQGLQVRTSDNDTGQFILDLQSSTSATGTNYGSHFVVDKSGKCGIGTTAPLRQLHIENTSANSEIAFTAGTSGVSSILFGDGQTGTDVYRGYLQYNHANDNMLFGIGAAGTMTLNTAANTFGLDFVTYQAPYGMRVRTTGSYSHQEGIYLADHANNLKWKANMDGSSNQLGASNATAHNATSDYRLKENIEDLTDGITKVKQLQPRKFNWISDETNTLEDGFIAHEVATVVPSVVKGSKDGVVVWQEGEELPDGVSLGDNKLDDDGNTIPEYQGIEYGKLTVVLTKALQEAIAKIETLETKVAALEAE